jgi:hypothetical protein
LGHKVSGYIARNSVNGRVGIPATTIVPNIIIATLRAGSIVVRRYTRNLLVIKNKMIIFLRIAEMGDKKIYENKFFHKLKIVNIYEANNNLNDFNFCERCENRT